MKPVSLLLASVLAISGASFVAPQPVAAAEDLAAKGAAILKAADDRAVKFPDQTYTASMEIYKSGKLRTTMVFSMVTKGLVKQLIRFLQPGDVAGMKILMEGPDELYVYSPEFQKVRRIAAHMKNQGFNGSEFTPEDMVMARLSPMFDAVLVGKTGNETQLNLKPKVADSTSFSKLEIFIDSTVGGITRIHYFDGAGNHIRTQTREEWKAFEDGMIPTRIRMKNLKTTDETVINLSEIDVKTAIDDETFSRRTLMRG
jgi:outer membrane lipoprotein-sorting protein